MDDYKCWNMHGEGGVNDRTYKLVVQFNIDLISKQQQNISEDGDEGPSDSQRCEANQDSQTVGHDLSEDELVAISDNYVDIRQN